MRQPGLRVARHQRDRQGRDPVDRPGRGPSRARRARHPDPRRTPRSCRPLAISRRAARPATTSPLQIAEIWHDGQIVAMVVAETFEAAQRSRDAGQGRIRREAPTATFDSAGTTTEQASTRASRRSKDPSVGDAEAAFAARRGQDRRAISHADPAPQPDRAVHHHLRLGRRPADHVRAAASRSTACKTDRGRAARASIPDKVRRSPTSSAARSARKGIADRADRLDRASPRGGSAGR